jgi:FeS assembly SUF system protein
MNKDKNLDDFLPNKNSSYFNKLIKAEVFNKTINKEEIIDCIKVVMDPEIPVNLYDLGLIYSININDGNVIIEMTLTNPNCPVAGQMPENVGKSIEHLEGLKSIEVNLVWTPTWTKDLMSEDAKLALDIF